MPFSDPTDVKMVDGRCAAVLLAAMACFGLFQALSVPTNADVAWYLYAGGQLLDGARLGEDIVEVNAPLIIVLSMGVEVLARFAGCSAIALLPWLVTAMSCVSLAACAQIARPWPAAVRQSLLIGLAYVLFIDIGGMVGQREHLLVILAMPYVCALVRLADRDPISHSHAVAAGVAAAVGFALKPFFVPAWIALEGYVAVRRGVSTLRRPQFLAMMAAFLLYALGVVLWTPDYLAFAAESLSLYRAYQPYGDLPVILTSSFAFVLLTLLLAYRGAGSTARSLVDAGAIWAVMLSAAVFVQDKGWLYQWYPANAVATILLTVAAGTWAATSRFVTRAGVQAIAALLVIFFGLRTYAFWTIDPPQRQELDALVRQHARDEAILVLSSHLHSGFPLVNEANVRWASRYPTMWQLPAFCDQTTADTAETAVAPFYRSPQERQFLDAVLADLSSDRPALLIVDDLPPTPSLVEFDYLEYFRQDPRFVAALSNYRFLQQIGRYRIFLRANLECGD